MNEDDLARLHHMLDAAREAILFAEAKTLEDLKQDRMLLLSLVKEIEIVGEAASQISRESKAAIKGIP
ncbi:MAG: HepT-like ribonuclease domain-containing protein [Bryobacteraceae bacterium]